jgi:hypothetical protein
VLDNFDALSDCRWSPRTHPLFTADDQASVAALFSVCTTDTAAAPSSPTADGAAAAAAAARSGARSRPPAPLMQLVLSQYVRRGWFEPADASDIEVSLTDMPPQPEDDDAVAASASASASSAPASSATAAAGAGASKGPTTTPDDKMATDFVTKVKERCTDPAYKIFLETLEQSRHQESTNHPTTTTLLLEINQTMQELFKDEPDLFSGFSQFMPQDKFSGLKNLSWRVGGLVGLRAGGPTHRHKTHANQCHSHSVYVCARMCVYWCACVGVHWCACGVHVVCMCVHVCACVCMWCACACMRSA